MYRTGDIDNNVQKLKKSLHRLKFPGVVDWQGIIEGDPRSLLGILHYAFMDYSPNIAKYIVQKGYDLNGISDHRFIESLFRIGCNEFGYRASLTPNQFLSNHQFSEHKIIFTSEMVNRIINKHVTDMNQSHRKKNVWIQPMYPSYDVPTTSSRAKDRGKIWKHINLDSSSMNHHHNITHNIMENKPVSTMKTSTRPIPSVMKQKHQEKVLSENSEKENNVSPSSANIQAQSRPELEQVNKVTKMISIIQQSIEQLSVTVNAKFDRLNIRMAEVERRVGIGSNEVPCDRNSSLIQPTHIQEEEEEAPRAASPANIPLPRKQAPAWPPQVSQSFKSTYVHKPTIM